MIIGHKPNICQTLSGSAAAFSASFIFSEQKSEISDRYSKSSRRCILWALFSVNKRLCMFYSAKCFYLKTQKKCVWRTGLARAREERWKLERASWNSA